jgi:hypothetical protein
MHWLLYDSGKMVIGIAKARDHRGIEEKKGIDCGACRS